MKALVPILAAVAAAMLTADGAQAASTALEKLTTVQYLIGTWNCQHNVGSFAGTYTTTYARAVGDRWLEQRYDFPATQTEPAWHAEALMGYDERRQAWVRFLVASTGQYFAMRMTDTGDGGWSWKYVSFFAAQRPDSSDSDAVLAKKSDSEYVVDGPSYKENGTGPVVTEHHVCRKT
jgi:hypothetical protein